MSKEEGLPIDKHIFRFNRDIFGGSETFTYIGDGELGGKARGLAFIQEKIVPYFYKNPIPQVIVQVPRLTVITTRFFDLFLKNNDLFEIAFSQESDERIAHRFQKAELPPELLGDLRTFISKIHNPLAIRSSSILEDSAHSPFAGVYETKMIPNNQPDTDSRFNRLLEAIKFIYASTFFKKAKAYLMSVNHKTVDEKMAVIIQEIAGKRHGDRYYPNISGVARSYNFFPFGEAKFEDGVVNLALGLGKTIVDGELSWSYSPAFPDTDPPFNTTQDLLYQTQTKFWAVNMGKPPAYDPIKETEYLVKNNLNAAEYDNTLHLISSTYDIENDRINIGTGLPGPRIITFAPLRRSNIIPINDSLRSIIKRCEDTSGEKVEVEFAIDFDNSINLNADFSLLQLRPLVLSQEFVEINENDLSGSNVLLASKRVLGAGVIDTIQDIVYIKPETFDLKFSQQIAEQIEKVNYTLIENERHYLLIGLGRWGTSDPWLGIPVVWGQISGAKVIVESAIPDKGIELSQGYHFFHNLSNLGVGYFSLDYKNNYKIDWNWLAHQNIISETNFLRHVRLKSCLKVKIDARNRMGVILK
jgi:hypothetical protein